MFFLLIITLKNVKKVILEDLTNKVFDWLFFKLDCKIKNGKSFYWKIWEFQQIWESNSKISRLSQIITSKSIFTEE